MNSSLYGKEYTIPNNILSILKQQDSQRSDNLIKNGKISYSLLKKMKSDIENGVSDYGPEVKSWIDKQLRNSREDVDSIKRSQMRVGMQNKFKKTHEKDPNTNPTEPSSIDTKRKEFMGYDIYENKKNRIIRLTESQLKKVIENIIKENEQ